MIQRVHYHLKFERRRFEVVFDLKNDTATVSDDEGRAVSFKSSHQSAVEADRFVGRFISETKQKDDAAAAHGGEEYRRRLPKQRRLPLLLQ